MAIYKTSNGKWEARISYRDEYGDMKFKSKRFDLKREAVDFEYHFKSSLYDQVYEDNIVTFDQVYEDFIKNISINANQNTVNEKNRITNNFLHPLLGLKMNRITQRIYYDLWHDIASSNYSHSYKMKIIAQMKAIAYFAYVHYNVEDKTKTLPILRKPIGETTEMVVWSQEEFEQFNSHVEDYTMKALFHTLYYTGLRRGECLALQKSDLNNGTLTINKAIKHFSNGFIPPKTESSIRKVKLSKANIKKLLPLMETEGNFLFGGHESISISMVQRTFKEAILSAGVPDIRVHDLRHSHASYLINNGANIVAVSNRLGHANTQTTLRVYTHLMQESQDELLDILNS